MNGNKNRNRKRHTRKTKHIGTEFERDNNPQRFQYLTTVANTSQIRKRNIEKINVTLNDIDVMMIYTLRSPSYYSVREEIRACVCVPFGHSVC